MRCIIGIKKRITVLFAVLSACLCVGGCSVGAAALGLKPYTREIFAMDTYMSVTGYGRNAQAAVDEAIDEIRKIDGELSTGNAGSELSRLNASGEAELSSDGYGLVKRAVSIGDMTSGAMDISIYPIMKLWGFAGGELRVPSDDEINDTLEKVDYRNIEVGDVNEDGGGTVMLGDGQEIDLGGIAKGYTSGRIMEIFEKYELTAGAVYLGGNVQLYGAKADGSPYRCAIRDPLRPDDSDCVLGVLEAEDTAIITSGGYERSFTDDATGRLYHHIMDPKTGSSADNGLISVTIVSKDGTLADALSTAVYVMGLDDGTKLWREHRGEFDMVLMDDKGVVYVTSGIAESFESEYETVVLE